MRKPFLAPTGAVLATVMLVILGMMPTGADAFQREVSLWSGPRAGLGELLWTLELDPNPGSPIHRLFEGNDVGFPESLFNNRHYFDGFNRVNPRFAYSIDGQRIYAGGNQTGEILYFLQPTGRFIRVHRGANPIAPIIYTFARERVYEGPNAQGQILLSTSGNLLRQDVPIVQVVTILLQRELEPRLRALETASGSATLDLGVSRILHGPCSKGIAKSPYLVAQRICPPNVARIWQSEPSTMRNPKEPDLEGCYP
ncbi:MAG: hypothetical protein MAG451_01201 [Anaerolineales bacterium]|nr:hypothetical protein [Anaerolineales bacterium]